MAKNRVVSIPTFNPKDTLKSIRENSLNPVIQRVTQVETIIESEIVPAVKKGFVDARLDKTTSKIYLERAGKHDTPPLADTVIDLSSIVPAYAGIEIKGLTGDEKNTSKVCFEDAAITKNGDDFTYVTYNWSDIVLKNQLFTGARVDPETSFSDYSEIDIQGPGSKYFKVVGTTPTLPGRLTIELPEVPEILKGSVNDKTPGISDVKAIKVTGNVGGSIITPEGVLELDLPDSAGKFNVGYFQGFFGSTGDLETLDPTTLHVDRSSAYVKQTIVGVDVYILYMYKGDKTWVPVTNRAPLVFDKDGEPTQAIISVKGNSDIKVNDKGELDLDGLMNKEDHSANYLGIYKTLDEIKAIPNPVENRSYAMLNLEKTHGLLPYMYMALPDKPDEPGWVLAPSLGHLMDVEGATTETGYKPIYGIKARNKAWKVTPAGVLDIPEYPQGMINAAVVGTTSSTPSSRGDIRYLRYMGGIADVKLDVPQKIAIIQPAQRIIQEFDDKSRAELNAEDYLGKIYYDKSTGKWMGMTSKNVAEGEQKWTPVLHKSMSEEVSDLTKRYPQKTPQVVLEEGSDDHILWTRNGETWVDADSTAIPKIMVEPKCGGFIKTRVKDTIDFPTGLETRVQTFTTDDGTGRTFARSYDRDKSVMGKTVWKPWVRTSYSIDDLKAHEIDPNAHSTHHKWYKTFALEFLWNNIASDGILTQTEVFPILDSYGSSSKDTSSLYVPYTGKFRVIWRMHFEGYRDSARELPTDGFWKLTLIKGRRGQTATTDIGIWQTEPPKKGDKRFTSMVFTQDNIEMDFHDTLSFKVEWTGNDSDLAAAAPKLRSIGTRSFVTIEDTNSADGTFNQNALMQLLGRTLSRGNVAIHTHMSGADEDQLPVRTYAETTDPYYAVMKPITPPLLEGEVDGRI